ncbi:MAG: hypothetical protein JW969_19345 [Spirochaetales bacterium]|nr:hypothetical protein [Spirochaetales bacterium]
MTHYHQDNLGGINFLKKAGIKVVSTPLTKKLASKTGFIIDYPEIDTAVWNYCLGDRKIEIFCPGAGHTIDNIVVWIEDEKVLFGGCLIKALRAKNPGNINDADLEQWPASVNNLISRYKKIKTVIPGHLEHGGTELLTHTLELLKNREAQ